MSTHRRLARLERRYVDLCRKHEWQPSPAQRDALFAKVENIDAAAAVREAKAKFGEDSPEYTAAMERWIELGLAAFESVAIAST